MCLCGGSPLPVAVHTGFESAFGCAVLEGYGLSESSPLACVNRIGRPRVPGTIGVPVDGVEMRVVDRDGKEVPDGGVGEIVIRGHNVMKGYWRRPEATAEAVRDGWLHTGDLGTRDARGDFRVVDRLKDVVIRGGFNVYPREVEEVLHLHPDVAEAAVLGVPHPVHGQEVAAAVVLRPGRYVSPPSCGPTCASGSPRTSIRAESGSPTPCRRGRRARSSSARSSRRAGGPADPPLTGVGEILVPSREGRCSGRGAGGA